MIYIVTSPEINGCVVAAFDNLKAARRCLLDQLHEHGYNTENGHWYQIAPRYCTYDIDWNLNPGVFEDIDLQIRMIEVNAQPPCSTAEGRPTPRFL